MYKLIGGLVVLLIVGGTGTPANAAPWCAYYSPSTYNCGFHTYQQCLATISGVGGYCARNRFEGNTSNPRPARRKTRDDWRW